MVPPPTTNRLSCTRTSFSSRLFSTPQEKKDKEQIDEEINEEIELSNISFDEAGKGLLEEEDAVRLEESGDFDTNPAVRSVDCCVKCTSRALALMSMLTCFELLFAFVPLTSIHHHHSSTNRTILIK